MSHRPLFLASRLAAAAVLVGFCSAAASSVAAPELRRGDRSTLVGTKVQGDQYTVEIDAAAVKVGETGAIVVTISPTAGFKLNEEFPTKLTVEDPPEGLSFHAPTLKKSEGRLDDKGNFTFRMPVVASRAGEFAVEAKLKFSVCTADKCVVQRQALTTKLKAE